MLEGVHVLNAIDWIPTMLATAGDGPGRNVPAAPGHVNISKWVSLNETEKTSRTRT
jgi:hypothetical protein